MEPNAGIYSSLALDSSGNPHIIYFNDGLKYAVQNGSSWDIQVVDVDGWGGSLTLDSTGNPHIVYTNQMVYCMLLLTTCFQQYRLRHPSQDHLNMGISFLQQ